MLRVGERLVDPGLDHARIQYITGVPHLHDFTHSVLEGHPVSHFVLSDAVSAVLLSAGALIYAEFGCMTLSTVNDNIRGLDRRAVFIWWVHGASHGPGDALAAAHGLLCSKVAATGVDALGEVIVLHFDVLSEGAFGSDIRRLGPACCTDLNFGGKTMGYFSRPGVQSC